MVASHAMGLSHTQMPNGFILAADSRRNGKEHTDAAIAGQANAIGHTLVTNNVGEISQVPGLVYEDWA